MLGMEYCQLTVVRWFSKGWWWDDVLGVRSLLGINSCDGGKDWQREKSNRDTGQPGGGTLELTQNKCLELYTSLKSMVSPTFSRLTQTAPRWAWLQAKQLCNWGRAWRSWRLEAVCRLHFPQLISKSCLEEGISPCYISVSTTLMG